MSQIARLALVWAIFRTDQRNIAVGVSQRSNVSGPILNGAANCSRSALHRRAGGHPYCGGLTELPSSTSELRYLRAKCSSILPYRRAAKMLGELLPISDGAVSHATLRRHALAVGAHLDQRVTEPDEYDWPESRRDPVPTSTRLIVAIDGTCVRCNLDTGL